MLTYSIAILFIMGIINLLFIKKMWLFIAINLSLVICMIIKSIFFYNNTIGNLISAPIQYLILYEIRVELICLIILIIGGFGLKRLNLF